MAEHEAEKTRIISKAEEAEKTVIGPDRPYTKLIAKPEGEATIIAERPLGAEATVIGEPVQVSLGDLRPYLSLECLAYNHFALASQPTQNYLLANLSAGYEGGKKLGRPPVALVLVLDKSGSMEGRPWEHLMMAVRYIASQLTPADLLGIVVFDEYVETLLEPKPVLDAEEPVSIMAKVTPRGTTNLHAGLVRGVGLLKDAKAKGAVKRILLLTDGDVNEGVTEYSQIVMEARIARTYQIGVSTLGLGIEYNEELLTGIAKHGAGNYHYIETPEDLAEAFSQEMESLFKVVAQAVSLTLRLGRGVRFDRVYGFAHEQVGDRVEIALPDLAAGENLPVLTRLVLQGGEPGEETSVEVDLAFRYAGSDEVRHLREVVTYTYTDDRQKLLEGINRAVDRIMREKDVVEEIAQATQMMERDPASATRILAKAQAELARRGRASDATLIAAGVEKAERGAVADATKLISQSLFALEQGRATSPQELDLASEAEEAVRRATAPTSFSGEEEGEKAMEEKRGPVGEVLEARQAGGEAGEAGEGSPVARLVEVGGELSFTLFAHSRYRLGRKEGELIIPEDIYVSRLHGEFEVGRDQVRYRDLGSSNGSVLNGERLPAEHWVELSDGDTLTVGQTSLRLEKIVPLLPPQEEQETPGGEKPVVEVPGEEEKAEETEAHPAEQPVPTGGEQVSESGDLEVMAAAAGVGPEVGEMAPEEEITTPTYLLVRVEDGKSWPIGPGETVFGRGGSGCDRVIDGDEYISRRHFAICLEADGTLSITDLDSTNGTTVDGKELEPRVSYPLAPGAEIKVGKTTLTIKVPEELVVEGEEAGEAPPQGEEEGQEGPPSQGEELDSWEGEGGAGAPPSSKGEEQGS